MQAPTRAIGDEAHHLRLNAGLQNLYDWCERQASAQESIGLFADTERPLRAWLEWNGDDDTAREADIAASQEQGKAEIAAAEHDAEETRRWLQGRQDIQIDIINKMFADAGQPSEPIVPDADGRHTGNPACYLCAAALLRQQEGFL